MAINILTAIRQKPEPLDFVWPGFPTGTVGALVSPGGVGKSLFALQAAIAVAGGPDLLELKPNHTGKVVYLTAEDPKSILIHRLYAIGQKLDQEEQEKVAENLTVEPIFGKRLNIMRKSHLKQIIEMCTGSRLVILDSISRFHTKDENSNSDMMRLTSALEYIITQTNTTILFLHHTNKLAAMAERSDRQQIARGASALIDNTYWCAFLCKMTKEEANILTDDNLSIKPIIEKRRNLYLRFSISKNTDTFLPEDKWFIHGENGILKPIDLVSIKKAKIEAKIRQFERL